MLLYGFLWKTGTNYLGIVLTKRALMRENLSFGFASVQASTQPAELPRLDRILRFCLKQISSYRTRNVSKGHGCPCYCQISINRESWRHDAIWAILKLTYVRTGVTLHCHGGGIITNRADPDQAALARATRSGSTLFAYGNMIRYDTSGPDKWFLCSMYKLESIFILLFIVGGA